MAKKKKNYWTRQLKLCRHEWARNSPERKECFADAKLIPFQTKDLPKWMCAQCDEGFALSDLNCDHVEPIGNTVPQTLEEYLECVKKLHVKVVGLQILCKTCHKLKTKEELRSKARQIHLEIVHRFISPPSALEGLDISVLKKLSNAVLKMDSSDEKVKKSAEKRYDQLCKKYL